MRLSAMAARVSRYAAAVAAVAVATVLQRLLWFVLPLPFFLFYPTVFLVARFAGLGPALLCIALSLLSVTYWFLPPYASFAIHRLQDVAELVVFGAIVTGVSFVIDRLRISNLKAEQSTRDLRHTTEVVLALTTVTLQQLPLPEFLTAVCAQVKALFHADTARIFLADEGSKELVSLASVGLEPHLETGFRVPFERGVVGQIFSRGRPVAFADLSRLDVVSPFLLEHVRSVMGAPLTATDMGKLGVVDVGAFDEREFSAGDQALLALVGERIGQAIALTRARDDLRATDARLRCALSRLEVTLGHAAHGIVFMDAKTGVLEANRAAEKIVGQTLTGTRIGEGLSVLYDPNGNVVPLEDWPGIRALRGETVSDFEAVIVRAPDQQRLPIRTSATPVLDAKGSVDGAVLTFEDISVAKELERLREEFAAIVAHDLRNPVSAILMNAEVLLREAKGKEQVTVRALSIERIRRAAARLGDMVNDLLDASRIDVSQLALNRQPIHAKQAAESLLEQIRPTLGEHSLKLRIEGEPGEVFVDRLRFDQILTNLLENAAKYSPQGTSIDLTVNPIDDGVVFAVKDQGMGIAPEEIPHLFDRFYQTQRARELKRGLGLGLYISKGFVEAHGGRVWVESKINRGSTFYVWLPSPPMAPERPGEHRAAH